MLAADEGPRVSTRRFHLLRPVGLGSREAWVARASWPDGHCRLVTLEWLPEGVVLEPGQ